jgi:hypothetical protein
MKTSKLLNEDLAPALREREEAKAAIIKKKQEKQQKLSLISEGLQRLDKHSSLMKDITQAKFNPRSEPKFFNTLDRLDNAEAYKEAERVDGKLALNDFISG